MIIAFSIRKLAPFNQNPTKVANSMAFILYCLNLRKFGWKSVKEKSKQVELIHRKYDFYRVLYLVLHKFAEKLFSVNWVVENYLITVHSASLHSIIAIEIGWSLLQVRLWVICILFIFFFCSSLFWFVFSDAYTLSMTLKVDVLFTQKWRSKITHFVHLCTGKIQSGKMNGIILIIIFSFIYSNMVGNISEIVTIKLLWFLTIQMIWTEKISVFI